MASLIVGTETAADHVMPGAAARQPMAREVPIQSIVPNPYQPRSELNREALEQLAQTIRATGVIQPIVVRPHGGNYQLVAGERRWRAAQNAGLNTIPTVIRELTDEQVLLIALIENVQREDLNAIDRALAYRDCCGRFGLSPETLASHLGEDRSTVANYIRLLDLPQPIQELVRSRSLSMGHARSLAGLTDRDLAVSLARRAVDDGLSVRDLEQLVRKGRDGSEHAQPGATRRTRDLPPLIRDLQERFCTVLQTRVNIREGRRKHTGKIVIEYASLDDFDRIADRLGVVLDDL